MGQWWLLCTIKVVSGLCSRRNTGQKLRSSTSTLIFTEVNLYLPGERGQYMPMLLNPTRAPNALPKKHNGHIRRETIRGLSRTMETLRWFASRVHQLAIWMEVALIWRIMGMVSWWEALMLFSVLSRFYQHESIFTLHLSYNQRLASLLLVVDSFQNPFLFQSLI